MPTAPPARRQFPLADWIEDHAELPYSLGGSGMKHALRSTDAILARGPRAPPDDDALRAELAARVGVDEGRLLLTHGGTEADALVLFYLARSLHRSLGRTPTFASPRPEYPPLTDVAAWSGFRPTEGASADLLVRSNPHNPTGEWLDAPGLESRFGGSTTWLLDEAFREFTEVRSIAATLPDRAWVTGTLTKAFGADAVRVGWVVPPVAEVEGFRAFHGLVTDEIPDASVGLARDLLADAPAILREVRSIFGRNRAALLAKLPGLPDLAAPVAFDRPGPPDAEPLCRRALADGVLTCPGRFFGDPSGIRIGLTRPKFPEYLERYFAHRRAFLGEGVSPARRARNPASRRRPA